ncbi:unnamed protein product, partial [marine sediment metagenome]
EPATRNLSILLITHHLLLYTTRYMLYANNQ